jgi:hypothetical protein
MTAKRRCLVGGCQIQSISDLCALNFTPKSPIRKQKYESLLVKSFNAIPAKAGIQVIQGLLDPGLRRGDGFIEFCKSLMSIPVRFGK